MKKTTVLTLSFCMLSALLTVACQSDIPKEEYRNYTATHENVKAYMNLRLGEKTFHGKYRIIFPGNAIDSGEVKGKVLNDTLMGDYRYKQYGWKEMKIRPFILLHKGDSLIQGTGMELLYLGVFYFAPESISFENPRFVFYPDH
ncbi:hypothetical protein ACR79T_04265 [Sphingobacterium spiritivorum]|uniref:hypothetical protein n=1 Tax=Sphingobacterium spiritivorum TaxID=258 RepID=UPI003DA6361E